MAKTVIAVQNIWKQYRLGVVGTGTLSNDLKRWMHRVSGREDPFLKVGEVNDRTKKSESDLVWALQDISFDVEEGDVVGIIGKNGAGKSTILKILSRVTIQTKGEIKVRGRIASLLEVGTGFHPDLTGRENVFLNGAILGMKNAEIRSKFDEIVAFSGVERYIDTPVKRYSSGMYVRLAFAVAAHLETEILIIDEVLAVGDAEFQKKCLGKLKDVSGHGKTVLFVSHNMTAMKSLCTKGILLKHGIATNSGSIDEVIDYYTTEAGKERSIEYTFTEEHDKEAQILKISILDSNGIATGEVDLTKSFSVSIEYVIHQPMAGLVAGFSISQAKESENLIVSNEAELNPERLKLRTPGYYKNKIRIPEKLLNVGSYRLKVGITAHKNVYDAVDDVFFDVYDSIGIVQVLGYDRKFSILSAQFPWELEMKIGNSY